MDRAGLAGFLTVPRLLQGGLGLLIISGPWFMGVYFPRHQYIWCAPIAAIALAALLRSGSRPGWRQADLLVAALALLYLAGCAVAINPGLAIIEVIKYTAAALFYLAAFLLCRQLKQLLWVVYLAALVVAAGAIVFSTGRIYYPDGFTGVFTSFLQYRNLTAAYLGAAVLVGLCLWAEDTKAAPAGKMALVFWPASLTLLLFVARGTYSRGGLLVLALLFIWLAWQVVGTTSRAVLFSFARQVVVTTITVSIYLHYVRQKFLIPALVLLFCNLLLAVALEMRREVRSGDEVRVVPETAAETGRAGLGPGEKLGILLVAALLVLGVLISPGYFARYEKQQLVEKSRTSEVNVWHRLYYSRDAWLLVAQRPFTGWGGGGWQDAYRQQQKYLYHSKRVHNQYAEVAVETGLPGLLVYLGVWALFIGRAGQLYSRSRGGEKNIAGAALGYLLFFALHTAMDFDFSYLAVLGTVWAVGGAVSREQAKSSPAPGKAVYQGGLAFLLLSVLAVSLWLGTAEWCYQRALRQHMAGRPAAARPELMRALALNPWQADYYRLASKLALAEGDAAAGLKWATRGQAAAPRSVLMVEQTVQAAQAAGDIDTALAAARRYVQLFPCDIAGRDRLAELQLQAAAERLQQRDKSAARQYLAACRATLEQTQRFWAQVPEKYRRLWHDPPQIPTARQVWLQQQIAALQRELE